MPFLANLITEYSPVTLPAQIQVWTPGQTPFSTNGSVFAMVATYLCAVFGGKMFMAAHDPLKLNKLFQIHNAFLCVASLVLLALIAEEVIPILWNNGLFHALCAEEGYTPRLETYYILNYYYKYYEFVDTMFLVFKKKPLRFLHVYHHAATAVLAYVQVNSHGTLAWAIASLNLAVHVVMYYYYFMTARGYRIWWKRYLTTMQITQFVVDIAILVLAAYSKFAVNYARFLPNKGNCSGRVDNGIFCGALIISYLGLFIDFYNQTFKPTQKLKGRANTNAEERAIVNGN